ncbi:MAG: DUF2853 family protein [Hellea sp.]|nr:DUF2853 family protein [Hellea sp.]
MKVAPKKVEAIAADKTVVAKPSKPVVAAKIVEAAKPVETIDPVKDAKTIETAKPIETPRHVPYFLDVKRYDPFASEEIVRKIVNHCGIALNSEDARFVACSDEAERVTVRESWLKKKLELTASDTDLDKKVMEICSLMQRDQKKNRVTFYYMLAKKERKLEAL